LPLYGKILYEQRHLLYADVQKRLSEKFGFLGVIATITFAGVVLVPQYASSILMAGF